MWPIYRYPSSALCYSVQHHVGQQTVVQQIGSRLRANKVAVSGRAVKVYVQVRAGHWPASRVADLSPDLHRTAQWHRVSSFHTISPYYQRWPLNVWFYACIVQLVIHRLGDINFIFHREIKGRRFFPHYGSR